MERLSLAEQVRHTKRWLRVHWLHGLAGALGAVLFAEIAYLWSWTSALPVVRIAPSFTLLSSLGTPVSFRALTGKVRVIFFYSARYQPLYARSLGVLEQLNRQLVTQGTLGREVVFLTIDYDALPSGAQTRANNSGFDRQTQWTVLHGTPSETRQVLQGFGLPARSTAQVMQDTLQDDGVFLVDQAGNVRRYYADDNLQSDQLFADIHNLLAHAPPSD